MSKTAMYIFINKGLNMSIGKACAQASHAAVEAYVLTRDNNPDILDTWYSGGHYTKLVLEASNEQNLYTIQKYLSERGFKSKIIIDEGLTEIDAHQATALGVEIVDREDQHVSDTFSSFKLFRDKIRVVVEVDK